MNSPPEFVNASCLANILFAVIKEANPSCFAQCGPGADRGDQCFMSCVVETVLGNQATGTGGINVQNMVTAWESAFTGGKCPAVHPQVLKNRVI